MLTVEQARVYDRKMRALDKRVREAHRDDVMRAVAGWSAPGGGLPSSPPGVSLSRGGGGGRAAVLDVLSDGTFTRASDGTYYDGANLQTAATNVRRPEGTGLLIEGGRTNYARNSAPPTVSPYWVINNAAVFTANSGPQFIPGVGAARVDLAADAASRATTVFTVAPADSLSVALSCWVRSVTGTGTVRLVFQDKAGAISFGPDIPVTTSWQLVSLVIGAGIGAALPRMGIANGSDAVARSVYLAGMQAETDVYYPSRHIDVPAATQVSRSPDVLTCAVGQYPASFLTAGFRLSYKPRYSSAELLAEFVSEHRLMGVASAANVLRLVESAGSARVQVIEGGVSRLFTGACTWSREQDLGVEVYPNLGLLVLTGFTTGNGTYPGTAFSWPSDVLAIGNSPAGAATTYCFGVFDRFIWGA